jgi:predicted phosphodiesterase
MRVQVLTDLHLEFHADGGASFLKELDPEGVDVLLVCGDLANGKTLAQALLSLCALYPRVLFVVGNHEYYGSSPKKVHKALASLDRDIRNFDWLHHRAVKVGDLRFAGTPLWFPKPTDPMVLMDRYGVNDFNVIRGFDPWVYDEHRRAREFLEREGPKADVILTHHVPMSSCVAARFRGQTTNHYFTTDMTPEIDAWQPKLWCFGHTHDRMWLQRGGTLLACNPFGYPMEQMIRERGHYVVNCLIDVDADGARFVGDARPGWEYEGPMRVTDGPIFVRRG